MTATSVWQITKHRQASHPPVFALQQLQFGLDMLLIRDRRGDLAEGLDRHRHRKQRVDTATRILRHYRQLPLETVARHEVGHAVMAVQCGGSATRIILGRTASGSNFGRANWIIPPSIEKRLLVLSGGVLALYLHHRQSDAPTFQDFRAWTSTLDGYAMTISGGGDWKDILQLTNQPKGQDIDDYLERAVRPYFDEGVELLERASNQLDELTDRVVSNPPGIGRFALQRFFAGRPRSRWAERLDRPVVLWAAKAELRLRR